MSNSTTYINSRFKKYLMYWILLVFSVVFYEFIDLQTNLNNLMIYTMFLSPVFYVFYHKRLEWSDASLIVVFLLMLMSNIIHPEYFRISTVLYSGLFFTTFLLYKSLCKTNTITIIQYQKIIKYIIYAYAIVLIIQQLQTALGLPVFNRIPWAFNEAYKLNTLSQEPSNTLLIMPLLMFSYIKMAEILRKEKRYHFVNDIKKDKYVWLAFLYVCLTCGSFTVFFSLPVFFCYFINRKTLRYLPFVLFVGLGIGLVAFFVIQKSNTFLLERFTNLLQNTNITAGNIGGDSSSSVRTMPFIVFFQSFNFFDISTWMGHGIDQFELRTSIALFGNNYKLGAGNKNILALFYDYGLIAGLFFFYFLIKNTAPKLWSFEMLFYILLFTIIDFNHYVLWIYILLMYTNMYFKKKYAKLQATQKSIDG